VPDSRAARPGQARRAGHHAAYVALPR